MATRYIRSGATGANDGTSKTDAFTTLSAALAASTNADLLLIASDHDDRQAVTSTLNVTFPTSPGLRLLCINFGTDALTTGAKTGITTGNYGLALVNSAYVYGVEFDGSSSNTSTADILLHNITANGCHQVFENCTFYLTTTSTGGDITISTSNTNFDDCYFEFRSCAYRYTNTSQTLKFNSGRVLIDNLSFPGSQPATLINLLGACAGEIVMRGTDLSGLSSPTLVDGTSNPHKVTFSQCKLPATYTVLTTTSTTGGSAEVTLLDCYGASGTPGQIQHHTALGSTVCDFATYLTGGLAGRSFRITTTANANRAAAYVTPFIDLDILSGFSSITPYLEVLRNNGTAAAYTDAEVFARFKAKITSGSALAPNYSDAASPEAAGAAQAAGIGTGSWTIASSNSPYSFKCGLASSITPAEAGQCRAQLVVGVASVTLFLDPQIRT